MRTASLILASATVFAGCSAARDAVGILGSLQTVQREVARATGHANITVNLSNNRYLTVGVVNSPWRELPRAERHAKAQEIAAVAYKALPSRDSLEAVGVTFVVHRSFLLVFNFNNATDHFSFTIPELTGIPEGDTTATGGTPPAEGHAREPGGAGERADEPDGTLR